MEPEYAINIIEQICIEFGDYDDKHKKDIADALVYAKKSLEKQIPRNPKRIDKNEDAGTWKAICPNCGALLMEYKVEGSLHFPEYYTYSNHCNCGQALDWNDWS